MAIYNFYREPIFKYYKEQIDFLLRSRENLENINIKKSLNMNLILSSACFTEGVMEHLAKCLLGYYRLVYNEINIPEFELRKSMNKYFERIEADVYQRISQGTGVDNYDRLFELLLGKSFKKADAFKLILEPVQILFQLRNVIAHAKEVSAYEVSAYWNNNVFEENFYGGYKKAEKFLMKNGLLKKRYIETQNIEIFCEDSVADYFYEITQQFIEKLKIFSESNILISDVLYGRLNAYNQENHSNLSFLEFCGMHAHAIKK